jgi:hypothetical protein
MTAIDFPVFIGSEETAIQLLGGEKRVSEWIQRDEPTVGLFLRPGDPMSHEVRGKKTETNNFLIRMPRPKFPSSSSSSSSSSSLHEAKTSELVHPTFEGVISKTFVFEGMADFSFLPTGIPVSIDGKFVKTFLDEMESTHGSDYIASSEPVVGSIAAAEDHWKKNTSSLNNGGRIKSIIPRIIINAQESAIPSSSFSWVDRLNRHLNLSPANFSIIDEPQPYTFTGASVEQTSQVVEKRLEYRESFSLKRAYYDFENDLPVPSEPLVVSQVLFKTEYSLDEILQKLKDAFILRPVWTLSALGIYLLMDMRSFRMQLPAAAYFVRGGCFRNMWIRLGFDPRLDSSSRIFMMAECRIPNHIWKLIPEDIRSQSTDSMMALNKTERLTEKTPTTSKITSKTTKGISALKGTRPSSSSSKSKNVAWAEIKSTADNDVIDGDEKAGSGGEVEDKVDDEDDVIVDTMELSVPREGAPWPWTYWCGGPLVRRQGVQIIDLLWSPVDVGLFFKSAGFEHGVGFIPAGSLISKNPTVSIGPRGVVQPISSESIVEALLYLPTSVAFSKNIGWLSQGVTDQIRRQVSRDVCDYITRNSPLLNSAQIGGHELSSSLVKVSPEDGGGRGETGASKGRQDSSKSSSGKKRARIEVDEEFDASNEAKKN